LFFLSNPAAYSNSYEFAAVHRTAGYPAAKKFEHITSLLLSMLLSFCKNLLSVGEQHGEQVFTKGRGFRILRRSIRLIPFALLQENAKDRKEKLETCLNGKSSFDSSSFQYQEPQVGKPTQDAALQAMLDNNKEQKDNSVPNRIQPRKQAGLYMIRCINNDWRYYGESKNISGRLASHRSLLTRQIHPNRVLQQDWNKYGPEAFDFIVLFMGEKWESPEVRRGKELELIVLDRALSYNILEGFDGEKTGVKNPFWGRVHSSETKRKISESMKNIPKDELGKKLSINGTIYPSIAEASRQTGMARKTIRKKLEDPSITNIFAVEDSGTVERPSQRE
jgi:hypothetical protein